MQNNKHSTVLLPQKHLSKAYAKPHAHMSPSAAPIVTPITSTNAISWRRELRSPPSATVFGGGGVAEGAEVTPPSPPSEWVVIGTGFGASSSLRAHTMTTRTITNEATREKKKRKENECQKALRRANALPAVCSGIIVPTATYLPQRLATIGGDCGLSCQNIECTKTPRI